MIQITKIFIRKCGYLFQTLRRTLWYKPKEHPYPLTLSNFNASIYACKRKACLISTKKYIQEYSGLFLIAKKITRKIFITIGQDAYFEKSPHIL